jgi:hypothetical protein
VNHSDGVVGYLQAKQDGGELVEIGSAFKVLKNFDDKIKAFILDFPQEWWTSLSIDPLIAKIGPVIDALKRVAPFTAWSSTRICWAPNSYTSKERSKSEVITCVSVRTCGPNVVFNTVHTFYDVRTERPNSWHVPGNGLITVTEHIMRTL